MNVTGSPVDLQDIVFKSNGEIPENGCTIWWWDNNLPGGDMGYVEAFFNYWWYDPDDESLADSDYCGEGPCWTNEDELPLRIKKTFAPGEGFYAKPDMPNPTLTLSGAVFGAEDTISVVRSIDFLASGKKLLCANPFPVNINLQDIVFKSNGEIPENGCTIWWWDNNLPGGDMGYVEAFFNYWWYDPDDESLADSDYCGEGPCWTNEDELPLLIKKSFAPGEGFYVKPDMPEPKLFFPNPFLKK